MGVLYIGFVSRGLETLWCECLLVATSHSEGFGGTPRRNFLNMKCSRSDSRPT